MDRIKFIYFEGCPEAKNVRSALLVAGIYDFEVIIQDRLPKGNIFLKFSSPSVIADDELIYGIRTDGERASCTFDVINFVDNRKLIERFRELPTKDSQSNKVTNSNRNYISILGTSFSILLVLKCPACIPGVVAILSALGMTFIVTPTGLRSIFVVMLALTILGLAYSYFKTHKNVYPLILGATFSILIYIGKFHYYQSTFNQSISLVALAGLIGSTLWDFKLKSKRKCPVCA